MDQAMKTLFNTSNAAAAWRHLFHPGDVVGIKSNAWARLPTPSELEDILQKNLKAAGVDEQNISVDDRGVARLGSIGNAVRRLERIELGVLGEIDGGSKFL